jgi:hypothetical protein
MANICNLQQAVVPDWITQQHGLLQQGAPIGH